MVWRTGGCPCSSGLCGNTLGLACSRCWIICGTRPGYGQQSSGPYGDSVAHGLLWGQTEQEEKNPSLFRYKKHGDGAGPEQAGGDRGVPHAAPLGDGFTRTLSPAQPGASREVSRGLPATKELSTSQSYFGNHLEASLYARGTAALSQEKEILHGLLGDPPGAFGLGEILHFEEYLGMVYVQTPAEHSAVQARPRPTASDFHPTTICIKAGQR